MIGQEKPNMTKVEEVKCLFNKLSSEDTLITST